MRNNIYVRYLIKVSAVGEDPDRKELITMPACCIFTVALEEEDENAGFITRQQGYYDLSPVLERFGELGLGY